MKNKKLPVFKMNIPIRYPKCVPKNHTHFHRFFFGYINGYAVGMSCGLLGNPPTRMGI